MTTAIAFTTPSAEAAARALNAILGESLATIRLRKLVARYAGITATVLITGESGTGKELVARAIHACSNRVRERFVAVNAATFSPGTIASELFGHARGSFTGAANVHRGLFEQAHGGTLFLDEVADLTPDAQAALLRVLENGEVRPLGGEHSRIVDVRVVCATHRDLGEMVRRGTFRADLFHRIRVLTITTPTLRERADDVPILARHLLSRHERDLGHRDISPDAMDTLTAYDWPGNVRQLASVLVRAAARTDLRVIDRAGIESAIEEEHRAVPGAGTRTPLPTRSAVTADDIRNAMYESGGLIAPAAKALGIARSTLRDRLRRLGIAHELT